MREENYWVRKLRRQRLSRRRFVGAAGATGAGAAGLFLVGCGDDEEPAGTPAAGATTAAPSGSPTAAASPTEAGPQKGGVARFSSENNTWDTFDADRSRFTPFAALLGYTNLGIVHYRSFERAEIEGALAESWEQPSGTEIIFKLRPNVFWHDKPPVNGRQVTVEDLKFFIERNKAGKLLDGTEDPNFYRKAEYASVEKVEVVDASTLRVTFSQPNPFFLGTLAGPYSKVQAPEAVEAFENKYQDLSADLIIGTGAYIMTQFAAEGSVRLERNEKFYDEVLIDAVQYFPLFTDQAAQQSAFEQKQLDAFSPRNVAVLNELLERYKDQIYQTRRFSTNPMAGTYYGGAPPWSDQRLIGAIFKVIDRHQMVQLLFQGAGAVSGNVPPSQQAFGITERELLTFEGYRLEKDQDIAEAKQMWEAANGASLGEVVIDIPDIWEGSFPGIGATIAGWLQSALGNSFRPEIQPYSTITNKIIKQEYGNGRANIWYGWISDVTKLEPTLDLFSIYNSSQPQFFQFGVKIDEVDKLTEQAVQELDIEKRKELCKEIERLLLKNWGAGIPYNVIQVINTLRWNYYKSGEDAPFVNSHNFYRDSWFDRNDPTWQGRPA